MTAEPQELSFSLDGLDEELRQGFIGIPGKGSTVQGSLELRSGTETQNVFLCGESIKVNLPENFDSSFINMSEIVAMKIDKCLDERMDKLIAPIDKTLKKIQNQQKIWSVSTILAPVVGTVAILLIAFAGESSRWLLDAGIVIGGISLGVAIISLLVTINANLNSRMDNLGDQYVNLSANMNNLQINLGSQISDLGNQYVSLGGSLNNLGINLGSQISNLSSQINQLQNKNIILPK